ncbi:hypothetical protein ACE6H2_023184 [Prunus campanulata]
MSGTEARGQNHEENKKTRMVNKVVDSIKTKNKKQRSAPHAPQPQEAPQQHDHQHEHHVISHHCSHHIHIKSLHLPRYQLLTQEQNENTRGPTVGLGSETSSKQRNALLNVNGWKKATLE